MTGSPQREGPHPRGYTTGDPRITRLSVSALAIGGLAGLIAFVLYHAIGLLTNAAFYGVLSAAFVSPAGNHLGLYVILIPALGGLVAGLLIRYGSPKIVGHGIPETMEAVVTRESRIEPKVGILKAVASVFTIGLGQPFGVEGPIIQTGGAFGSYVGQLLTVTPSERRILVATGAAAGMAAIFGTPISAVLLVVELLLFEFRVRSLIPIALGSAVGAGMHFLLISPQPLFPTPSYPVGSLAALPLFILLGIACGLLAVGVTRALYASERAFLRLPMGQPWLPVLGGLAVGILGFLVPDILGVGYNVIDDVLVGRLAITLVLLLIGAKLLAWLLAMGSQTSGGTLAPLFLVGGAFGYGIGYGFDLFAPGSPLPEVFAVAAMAAVFGAAARAPMASSVFALEVTRDFDVVVPIFVTVFVAELLAEYMLPETIMTERLKERGYAIRHIYEYNPLRLRRVREIMSDRVVTVSAHATVLELYRRFQLPGDPAFRLKRLPVLDGSKVVGMVDRERIYRELVDQGHPERPIREIADPNFVTIPPDATAYAAYSTLVLRKVPYLLVMDAHGSLLGYVSRTDLLEATRRKAEEDFVLQEGSGLARLRGWWAHRPSRPPRSSPTPAPSPGSEKPTASARPASASPPDAPGSSGAPVAPAPAPEDPKG